MDSAKFRSCNYPPASEASREVANLTERKNPHTPVYGVKEFVCVSVCYITRNKNHLKKRRHGMDEAGEMPFLS